MKAAGIRLANVMIHAELSMVLISGAPRGKQQTYAAFNERVPVATGAFDEEEALAKLARRYFEARGPATAKDFARWASLSMADARAGLGLVKDGLDHLVVDGLDYWFVPSPPVEDVDSPVVDLVQGYDECLMSYSESKPLLHPPEISFDKNQIAYLHAVLLGGRMVGHWRPAITSKAVVIDTFFYRPLRGAERRALDRAVERLGHYFGLPARLADSDKGA